MANDIMKYWTKVFSKPYPDGWKDKPNKTTPIRGKVMDAYDSAMDEVDDRVLSIGKSVVDHDFMIEQLAGRISETNKALNSAESDLRNLIMGVGDDLNDTNTAVAKCKNDISVLNNAAIASQKAIAELDDKKITKVYANSDGETVLADSDNGKIQDMILYGNSEQESTTGAQLYDVSKAQIGVAWNGATNTARAVVYVDVEPNTTYTISGNFSALDSVHWFEKVSESDTTFLTDVVLSGTKTITTTNTTGFIAVQFNKDGIVLSDVENAKVMLNAGTIALPWEPYTGGIPSPNPDYPQEIKSVVNPVITLSDGENSQTATLPFTLNAIPVSEGGNVTIDGQQYISDYVDISNKKIVRNVGITTLHNTDYDGSNSVGTNAYYIRMKIKAKNDNSSICVISDKFIGVPFDKRISNTNIDELMSQDGKVVLRTKNNTSLDWSTEEKCRQWLADNTPTIVYILETPTEEPLTDEQVNAFKELSTYYPTTNVAVTSDELDGYVTFDYPLCFESAAEYAVGSLQFAFESGLPMSTFRIYGSDSKESMYDIRIAVFDSTGAPKQLAQFSMYAYGGKSVGNGTVNTSYGTIRQSGSGYIQLETKSDYNWKVWISGKGWRVEKVE